LCIFTKKTANENHLNMTPSKIGALRSLNKHLTVYFWHRGKKPFYIDDLSIDLYEPKEKSKYIW